MMLFKTIILDVSNPYFPSITLNKPKYHNAFDLDMINEIYDALMLLSNSRDIRALFLGANGQSFSAGANLAWMQQSIEYTFEKNLQDATQLARLMHTLYHFPYPTIAFVQGNAYGGGVGLIAACDMAFAVKSAEFCFSEVRLGLIPSVISPYVINAIGERAARRYYLTAEKFNTQTALRLGLIHDEYTDITETKKTLQHQFISNSPNAMKEAKALITATSRAPINVHMIEDTTSRIAKIRTSAEGQEGLKAFLEKRNPLWKRNEDV
jgi:methylglutaconyl-CoA hydratase